MGDKEGDENTARERWGDERLIIKESKWMIIKSDGGSLWRGDRVAGKHYSSEFKKISAR